MTNASPAALVEMLRRSELLEPDRQEQLTRLLPELPREARPFAEALVQRGWLTPFQAKRLLEGLAAELVVGNYIILERIGRGQFADVSRARHRQDGHEVALKVIRPDERSDLHVLQRFRREVTALGRLSHPNLIRALDLEQIGTAHYYAMEFVAGINLDQVLAQVRQLPIGVACDYIYQAALALQHAHEHGLIHRDVQPANLLIAPPSLAGRTAALRHGRWGTIKLLDLGLARVTEEGADAVGGMNLTQAGFMIGTVDYVAPEQVLSAHAVDIRADVYGLGCCAYHMLAGQPPFPGEDIAVKLEQHQTQEPTKLEELRPELPPALALVVRTMMAKKPALRYQTPGEAAAALAVILDRLDESLLGLDWKLPENAAKEPARAPAKTPATDPVQTALLALLLALVVFLLGWLLLLR